MTLKFNNRLSITPTSEGGSGGGGESKYITIPMDWSEGRYTGSTWARQITWKIEDDTWILQTFQQNIYDTETGLIVAMYPPVTVRGFDINNDEYLNPTALYFKVTDSNNVVLIPFSPVYSVHVDVDKYGQSYKFVKDGYEVYWIISKVDDIPTLTINGVWHDGSEVVGAKVTYEIRVFQDDESIKISKYGATINNFLGDVDANGVYQEPLPFDLIFNGVKTVGLNGMSNLFENDTNIKSVSFPDLETASSSCFSRIFYQSSNLESASFPKLTTIQSYAFTQSFGYCRNLTSINFSNIEVINSPQVFANAFAYCLSLENVSFPKLKELSGSQVFYWSFSFSTSMTSISFPALRSDSFGSYTNQFNGMLYGVTGCTVHFPSNLQSVIGSWSDVTNGFGGTNTTVLFDLTATE